VRTGFVSLFTLLGVLALAAQDGANLTPAKRHGVDLDLKTYPQTAPKDVLGSLLKAVDAKRVDYVLAQLADPEWVDRRVKETSGGFAALVEECTARLVGNEAVVRRLKKMLAAGEWKIDTAAASVRLKETDDGVLFFRKMSGRWYVENRKN
jgi:hypothetical protein